ncbi:inhibitor of Bruton tyrosine kinase isoform X1 [Labeo rohita]|uniref:inhibitor of Bruton tyrosine kinase isoform X1 n=1 Tax=Labeo rohita TaxID=84645 RepID=UPI0021E23C49|nr:inhibitor of Bruton tyrosine kinase isoform X1 [Labeo rohita]
MSTGTPDCTPKCRSVRHAEEVIAALTSGSEGRLRGFLSVHCHNAATLRDEFGRTALHLAASLGKRDLLQWLLDSKHADMLAKDKESGWTALHRSAFYGQIHCLMGLIKRGGALSIQDKEGLSALDLTMKDRPAHVVFRNTDPTEVYTWGSNTNFSLGHGNQESRHHPEIVDLFSRSRIYVKQVVLCKFHSVFLSQKGQVYTCGHGQGGRLGHGDEQTYLVPRMVEGLLSHHCSQIAAARDHTVVLTEEGYVYTFGLNTHHQLGLAPPPASSQVPKQVTSKSLKGRSVIGVAAGRFHTVLWTRDAVYTVGLNGGQLGYLLEPNGEKCVTVPRQVSALHHKDLTISMAAASNGATVCVTEKGDVYLLADYQCKKLASKQLNLKKVLVSGGSLDHRIDPQLLHDGGGEKLVILALDEAGRVFCWRSTGTSVRQCRWAYGRQVFMSDIALSKNSMMFVTQDGEGFSGQWLGQYKKSVDKKDGGIEVSGHSDGGGVYERIRLEKVPYVHRAVSITMDSKGRNFGVLQADPKTSLYEVPSASASKSPQHFQRLLAEADETDSIHDVTLQAGDRTFAAHKYILSMRSDFFRKVLLPEGCKEGVGDGEVKKGEDAVGCDLLVLEKVPPEMLEQALEFIYTDSCEMLIHGTRPVVPRSNQSSDPEPQQQLIHSLQALGLENRSALDVYRSLPAKTREDAEKPKTKSTKSGKKGKSGNVGESGQNPVKMLQGVAKKLGLGSLSARLDGVKFENGKISVVQKKSGNKLRFNQKKCSYFCDVTLRSEDGKEFPCHKCVLCARLEYFNSMLGSPWIEASSCTALDMPTTSEILQAILEYIYTDESPTVKESVNVEFVCNVLVVADQLLITRLKEICEVAITENLTLKNAAELLEFATIYNADQLKLSCLQFIVLNMAALLESRALEILSDDVLVDLTAAYRRMIPAMQRRLITPYADAPDLSAYEDREWDSAVDCKSGSEADHSSDSLLKKAKMRAKRKPRRRSDSSGGYNLSDVIHSSPTDVIQSPPAAGLGHSVKACSVESLQELITSDSEGSYMGAGSPRDLQSPIFHDRPDTQDERRGLIGLKTPPGTPVLKNGPVPTQSSTPEPIPTVKASVCRPAPVLDLRAIMEMEANSLNRGATPKSPSSSSSSNTKVSVIPSKMSQKQRKMMALASREGSTESMSAKSPPSLTPVKPSKTWSTAVQSPPSSCSFRDLLVEEERRGKPSPVSPVTARSPAAAAGQPICAKRVTFKCGESSDPEKPAGPWVLRAVGSPPSTSTFASIVEEERQQEAALIRSREKPLALIQIEERAIQDLLLHYKAINNPEELILVERSPQGPIAIPTWNKH